MKHIFAVVPVFNRIEYTKQCLDAFYKQNYKNFTVIVCDSGSTDGTRLIVKKLYPSAKLIKGDESWWWSRATQEGIDFALRSADKEDYVLFMNNDCYFDKNYLNELLKSVKKEQTIVGSLCVDAHDKQKVVEAGIRFDWTRGLVYPVTQVTSDNLSYFTRVGIVKNIDALPGKGTLIPVTVFKQIGGLAVERLPHYIADYEFFSRAKNAGFDLIVNPKAMVYHHWLATGDSIAARKSYDLKTLYNLLLGRKSMNNIVDWVNFILMACPKKYQYKNLRLTLTKIIYYLCLVPSLFLLKILVKALYLVKLVIRVAIIKSYQLIVGCLDILRNILK